MNPDPVCIAKNNTKTNWPKTDKFQAKALEMLRIHGKFNGDYLRKVLPELAGKSNRELSDHI